MCKPFCGSAFPNARYGAVLGEAALSLSERADLADAFSESDLPYKVDIVDWHLIGDDFRRIVQANHIEIQTAE